MVFYRKNKKGNSKMNDKRKISSNFNIELFQDRLKKAMKNKGFTNASFSAITGISEPALTSYKRSNEPSIPSIDKVVTMANKLDISIDYLCGLDEMKTKSTKQTNKDISYKDIFNALRFLIDNMNLSISQEETSYDGDSITNLTLTICDRFGYAFDYSKEYIKIKNLISENRDVLIDSEQALIDNLLKRDCLEGCYYDKFTRSLANIENVPPWDLDDLNDIEFIPTSSNVPF